MYFSPVPLILVAILIVAALLSLAVWLWAIRRPAQIQPVQGDGAPAVLAAIWATDVPGLGVADEGKDWVDALYRRLPEGARVLRFERAALTLREANDVEVSGAVATRPDMVAVWCCVADATGGTPLADYLRELEAALKRLIDQTQATVALVNLPDITMLAGAGADPEKRDLVQGGLRRWNEAMAATASRFGGRVRQVDLYFVSGEVLGLPGGHERLAAIVWEALQ